MVQITDLAATKILEIQKTESIEENQALRICVRGGGCAGFGYELYFDEKKEVDQEFEVNGIKLFIDQMSMMYLMGVEIDYQNSLMGAGFKFNNPNVKSTCGCGMSFSA